MAQVVGVVLLGVAAWLLWSPWALIIAGLVLILAPEVGELMRGRRRQ